MRNKRLFATITALMLLTACGETGVSADELADYYSEKATEIAKDTAETAASKVNEKIESNEVTLGIKDGVTTAGEYAQDGYEYVTDEKTIEKAKEGAETAKNDTINFFDYFYYKIKDEWKDVVDALEAPPSSFAGNEYKYEDLTEYDALGEFKNPFLESKGIDTSADGTLIEQLKKFVNKTTEDAKDTTQEIKENHDTKHSKNTSQNAASTQAIDNSARNSVSDIVLGIVPEFTTSPYVVINNNIPFFSAEELTTDAFEYYSELDNLGRCGVAYANICKEIMPTEERTSIGQVKPSGWKQAKYDILKNEENTAGYLYARCHLIGFQLAGENANEKNLITGTFTQFNVLGMEPFENYVASYVRYYDKHVLYRVTPVYKGNNLVASGVLMEAQSVEDDTITFCVYVYNVAPGIVIDYADGSSHLE